jgi:hypothetical protein
VESSWRNTFGSFGDALGPLLGDPLGDSLGDTLGDELGATLGDELGAAIGEALGDSDAKNGPSSTRVTRRVCPGAAVAEPI